MLFSRAGEKESAINAIAAGVVDGGDRIIQNVKRSAPVDTGHLRASYGKFTPELIRRRYSPEEEHPANYDKPINELKKGGNRVRYKFGTQVPYCVIQEFWKPPHKEGRSPYQWAAVKEEATNLVKDISDSYIDWIKNGKRGVVRR